MHASVHCHNLFGPSLCVNKFLFSPVNHTSTLSYYPCSSNVPTIYHFCSIQLRFIQFVNSIYAHVILFILVFRICFGCLIPRYLYPSISVCLIYLSSGSCIPELSTCFSLFISITAHFSVQVTSGCPRRIFWPPGLKRQVDFCLHHKTLNHPRIEGGWLMSCPSGVRILLSSFSLLVSGTMITNNSNGDNGSPWKISLLTLACSYPLPSDISIILQLVMLLVINSMFLDVSTYHV